MRGADWRHPYGPDSSLDGLDRHPVVHVAFGDAEGLRGMGGQGAPDGGRVGIRRTPRIRAGQPLPGQYLAGRVPVAARIQRSTATSDSDVLSDPRWCEARRRRLQAAGSTTALRGRRRRRPRTRWARSLRSSTVTAVSPSARS